MMRVGIVRTSPWSVGGGYQYELLLMEALAAVAQSRQIEDELIYLAEPDPHLYNLISTGAVTFAGLPMRCISEPRYDQPSTLSFLHEIPEPLPSGPVLRLDRAKAMDLRRLGVDWLFQLSQNPFAFEARMPFVMPIHDLQHRRHPEFPEVTLHGQTEFREYLYGHACRHATLILVDSEFGKQDVLEFYGHLIDEDRIRVLPFFPPTRSVRVPDAAELRQVAQDYGLPPRFFFYPAQFWRHKNHHLIVEALKRIKDQTGAEIPVVFCGAYSDKVRAENFVDVVRTAERLGVAGQFSYLGWVPDSRIPALYALSAGLVMPTFFGPTNLPTLEAWHYGCPVITSDIRGLREQTGDAGLLVDPTSADDLAAAMMRLWQDPLLSAELVRRGRERLSHYSWTDFLTRVSGIVEEAGSRVRQGLSPGYPEVSL